MDQDFFPVVPLDGMMESVTDLTASTKSKFLNVLLNANRVVVFILALVHNRITTKQETQATDVPRYFKNGLKDALRLKRFQPNKMFWDRIENRLKGVGEEIKSNTDVRTCFRIDGHKYLVPSSFTFGQRTVEKGLVHVLETTVAPMCVYRLSSDANTERVVKKDSFFAARDQMWYDRFVLQPHKRYQFNQGTTYLFVTVQRTLFSLHLLVQHGKEVYGEDPFVHRRFVGNPYDLVPPTPRRIAAPPVTKNICLAPETIAVPPVPGNIFLEPDPPVPENIFFEPDPPRPENIFVSPSAPSKTMPAPSMPAPSLPAPSMPAPSLPAPSMPAPSLPAPSMPAPSLRNFKKRSREEDEPRVIKIARGVYDYPHPDVSTGWIRLDDEMRMCGFFTNDLPAQDEALNLSRDDVNLPPEPSKKTIPDLPVLDDLLFPSIPDEITLSPIPSEQEQFLSDLQMLDDLIFQSMQNQVTSSSTNEDEFTRASHEDIMEFAAEMLREEKEL